MKVVVVGSLWRSRWRCCGEGKNQEEKSWHASRVKPNLSHFLGMSGLDFIFRYVGLRFFLFHIF